eukprot:5032781-Pyramimonas_sp.AAC.1
MGLVSQPCVAIGRVARCGGAATAISQIAHVGRAGDTARGSKSAPTPSGHARSALAEARRSQAHGHR